MTPEMEVESTWAFRRLTSCPSVLKTLTWAPSGTVFGVIWLTSKTFGDDRQMGIGHVAIVNLIRVSDSHEQIPILLDDGNLVWNTRFE